MECAVCGNQGRAAHQCTVLGKYSATLLACGHCGLLYFKQPHWLQEAYSDAIATTDTGILLRNQRASLKVASLLLACSKAPAAAKYLDCAGGYGLFVRAMRDRGFDFYWADPYCQNLLAKGFEHQAANAPYEAVTAFEVFEHVEQPIEFAQSLLAQAAGAKTIIFTTNLFDGAPPPLDWWYYSFATGQHISFYQKKTLQFIADRIGMRFISRSGFHVFTASPDFSEAKVKAALSPLAPLLVKALGTGLSGKSVSDHELMTQKAAVSPL